jgi:nucleoside-diphosphate-sugar epimerase
MQHLFCFGIGYTAEYISGIIPKEWKLSGTKRSHKESGRFSTILFDELLLIPKDVTHILISIPPNEGGDIVWQRFAKQIRALPNLQWLGLFSTTGVYGDHQGGWVDENTPTNPQNQFSKQRVDAENQWLREFEQYGIPTHIFRVAGIYGPGRNILDRLQSNTTPIIRKEGHCFSRIHVEDIAQIVLHSMQHQTPGHIFNLADDEPAEIYKIAEYAAKLLGNIPIKFKELNLEELSPMEMNFYSENKKVRNDKIKEILKVKLLYPTYRDGLLSIAAILQI